MKSGRLQRFAFCMELGGVGLLVALATIDQLRAIASSIWSALAE